jgi:hypothetical protein
MSPVCEPTCAICGHALMVRDDLMLDGSFYHRGCWQSRLSNDETDDGRARIDPPDGDQKYLGDLARAVEEEKDGRTKQPAARMQVESA